jgi:hypothetical protein
MTSSIDKSPAFFAVDLACEATNNDDINSEKSTATDTGYKKLIHYLYKFIFINASYQSY